LDPVTRWATIAEYEFPLSSNVIYQRANNVDLRLDVITAGDPSVSRPTLIYFHGGGWLEGSKDGTLLYMLPYLARGMDTVDVEYRMAPQSLAPAAIEDTRCALHWVFDHASQYGFDRSKLVVSGHSAGGHLALMTGMLTPDAGFDNDCNRLTADWRTGTIQDVKVAAVVNFFGPTDLPQLLEGPNARNYAVRWFGGQSDRMEIAKRSSPLTYVHSGLPPILTIMGDKDPIVPYSQGVSLHNALDRAGVPNLLVTIAGGGHGSTEPFAWTREQNLRAQAAVFSFLEKYGILSPSK
jgi:acetyl esterase/lipase